jgi:pSer/pThr/pTyr-binding forkhead associated (FHA) protein
VALRAYDSTIRPIEMGRRLLGVVDAQVADDTKAIPHAYTVVLHPADRAAFSEVENELVRELAEVVTQHSERESYRLAEPAVVVLRDDNDAKRGSITVLPSLVSAKQPVTATTPNSADRDEAVMVQPIAASMSTPVAGAITSAIVLEDGTRHVLDTERVTIGRQSGCTITIRDTNVSREHAQLRRRPNGWTIRDIGSTNGTKLNGVRVEGEQMLANGDVIMLGAMKVTFEIS